MVDDDVSVVASHWGWRYLGRKNSALNDINVTIERGKTTVILGTSGSGKSTFLQAIAGVLGDEGNTSGELLVNGRDPRTNRGDVGLVLQDPDSQVVLAKVGDDIAFGCENLGVEREEIWKRVHQAIKDVGLKVDIHHPTQELSGGQKQRLALAAMSAMRPSVLALDEPTANIDPPGRKRLHMAVESMINSYHPTVVLVEHRLDMWADLIDNAIVFHNGSVQASGPFNWVIENYGEELESQGIWLPEKANYTTNPGLHSEKSQAELQSSDTAPQASNVPTTSTLDIEIEQFPPTSQTSPQTRSSATRITTTTLENSNSITTPNSPTVTTSNTQPAISVNDLSIGYEHPLREPLTFTIPAGKSTCIVGDNGCGKTTLMLTMAGLMPALSGSVEILTAEGVSPNPFKWKAKDYRSRLGVVFQEPDYQFLTKSVEEELRLGLKHLNLTTEEQEERITSTCERLGLASLRKAHPMTLSGGEKRRLSVATALITQPPILLLDEPTFGQDRRTWHELVAMLQELRDDKVTLVSVSHDEDFCEALGDKIIDLSLKPKQVRYA